MRCLAVCQTELVGRLLARGAQPARRDRVHRREQGARPPSPRRRRQRGGGRPPSGRHLRQGRPAAHDLRHHRGRPAAQPAQGARCRARRRRRARLPARHARRRRTTSGPPHCGPTSPSSRTSRWPSWSRPGCSTELNRSLTRARVQQYQRYFSDADRVLILAPSTIPIRTPSPAAWRCARCCAAPSTTAIIGAMQRVTRPENLRMAEAARHRRRARSRADQFAVVRAASRPSTCSRTTSAALLPHVDLVVDHHPEASRLHGGVQGHPRRLRLDVHDPHGAPAGRGRQHLGAHGDGDALRHQVRHALLRAPDQPRRPRRVLVPLSAGRRRPSSARWKARKSRSSGSTTSSRRWQQGRMARARVLRLPRRAAARGLHPLHGRLLPAARRRAVDDRLRAWSTTS